MKRLTTDNPRDNMETALNLFYIKDHETWVRGGGPAPNYPDVSLYDYMREIIKAHDLEITTTDNDTLGNHLAELLFDGIDTVEGIVATLYTAAWAFSELRERVKMCEDAGMFPQQIQAAAEQLHRQKELYSAAIETWGAEAQTTMVFEEMSELQKELCKDARGKENRDAIAEEIADVEIMLGQMKVLHDCREEVKRQKALKLERLAERITEAQQKKQRGFELMAVVRCRDCIHYGECGDCDVHPYDGRFNQDYFCADAERKGVEPFGSTSDNTPGS